MVPAPMEGDAQARHDAELRARIAASHAELVERIRRDGHDGAGFPNGDRSLGRLRAGRVDRILDGLR